MMKAALADENNISERMLAGGNDEESQKHTESASGCNFITSDLDLL